ncbi:MAG: OB-fold nucleic acid binding domain-containing protein [archaeon]
MNLKYDEILEKIEKTKGISRAEIEEKIKEKLKQLSDLISKEGAAHIIANEFGVKLYEVGIKHAKVNQLNPMLKGVELVAKVIQIYEIREFKVAAREGRVVNILVGDETGSCRLCLWDEHQIKEVADGKIKEGDIVKVSNGYVKENNRGYMELHLGNQSSWEINPKDIKIEVKSFTDHERKDIKDLKENDNVSIVGTLVQVFEPRFYDACPECGKKVEYRDDSFYCGQHGKVESKAQGVLNIVFDDGTDNIRVVFFRDNVGKILGVEDVSVLKEDSSKFQEIQRNLAGKQLEISGRVTKNDFFNRLEVVGNTVKEANPKALAMELKEK